MTKSSLMVEERKEPVDEVQTTVNIQPDQPIQEFHHKPSTCWYVMGIISTIFCCLPCGVIGLVHAMIAQHEGERGNFTGHRRRLYQAKCWISWSIALMSVILIGSFVYWGIELGWFERAYRFSCGWSPEWDRQWRDEFNYTTTAETVI